jgi:hypothetical protein
MLIRTPSARRLVIDPAHGRATWSIIPGSFSYRRDAHDYGYLQVVKAALDRKRRDTT